MTTPIALDPGVYFYGGKVYKVQKAVHGSGRMYAKELVVRETDNRGRLIPKDQRKGSFEYARGAIYDLRPEFRMTLEQAQRFGTVYGVCCNCGATLTDEVSIAAGIGPVCAKRFVRGDVPTFDAPTDEERAALDAKITAALAGTPDPEEPSRPAPPPTKAAQKDVAGGTIRVDQELGVALVGFDFDLTGFDPSLVAAIKLIPGRSFSGQHKTWTVPLDGDAAKMLLDLANRGRLVVQGEDVLSYLATRAAKNLEASKAIDADLPPIEGFGGPGLELRPFQRAGVAYLIANRRAILADEQGLGKTPESLAAVAYHDAYPALVACPDVAWTNWGRIATAWLPGKRIVLLSGQRRKMIGTIVDGKHVVSTSLSLEDEDLTGGNVDLIYDADVVIVASSNLSAWTAVPEKRKQLNAERIDEERARKRFVLNDVAWKAKILDEVQEYKEGGRVARGRAARTLARYDGPHRCRTTDEHLVYPTSGTPAINRMEEMIEPLEMIDMIDQFGGARGFLSKAATPEGRVALHKKLREICYVRRTKDQVLPDLPKAQRESVPILFDRTYYDERAANLRRFIEEKIAADSEFEESIAHLTEDEKKKARRDRLFSKVGALYGPARAIVEINYLKQVAVRAALPGFLAWIDAFLEQTTDPATGTGKKLLVFAYHRDVLRAVAERYNAPTIIGGMGTKRRVAAEDLFQTDPNVRIIVLNYTSASTALTLTAADTDVWLELPWRPGDVDQGEARCYGRINDPHGVNTYYLIPDGTIYEDIAEILDEKAQVLAQITDGRESSAQVSILSDLIARLEARATGRPDPGVSRDLSDGLTVDLAAADALPVPEDPDAQPTAYDDHGDRPADDDPIRWEADAELAR